MRYFWGGLLVLWSLTSDASNNTTTIINYTPTLPVGTSKPGTCFSGSIATPRAGAWRCMSGNQLFDPCFSLPKLTNAVICGADPSQNKGGFQLDLQSPIPSNKGLPPAPDSAWMVELQNGVVCSIFTGTQVIINGFGVVAYGCNDVNTPGTYSGLLSPFQTGPVWQVHKLTYTIRRGTPIPGQVEQVPVKTVWR